MLRCSHSLFTVTVIKESKTRIKKQKNIFLKYTQRKTHSQHINIKSIIHHVVTNIIKAVDVWTITVKGVGCSNTCSIWGVFCNSGGVYTLKGIYISELTLF